MTVGTRDPAMTQRQAHLEAALVAVLAADAIATTVATRRVLATLTEEMQLTRAKPGRIGSHQAAVLAALRRGPATAARIETEGGPGVPSAGVLDAVLARLVERRLVRMNPGYGPFAATYELTK
jgi:hypothetical protein